MNICSIEEVGKDEGSIDTFIRYAALIVAKYFTPYSGLSLASIDKPREHFDYVNALKLAIPRLSVSGGGGVDILTEAAAADIINARFKCLRPNRFRKKNGNFVGVLHDDKLMEDVVKALERQYFDDFLVLGMRPGEPGVTSIGKYGKRVAERAKPYSENASRFVNEKREYKETPIVIIGEPPLGINFGQALAAKLENAEFIPHYPHRRNNSALNEESIKDKIVVMSDSVYLPECDTTVAKYRDTLNSYGASGVYSIVEHGALGDFVDFSLHTSI